MDLVLGSGISGILAGYILGYPVIGKEIGGQLKAPFPLGPRILEKTPATEWLMYSLNLYIQPREFTVGYLCADIISSCPTLEFKEEYYKKTRGDGPVTSSCMSSGKSTIIGWDMDEIDLFRNLLKHVTVINETINSIQMDKSVKLSDGSIITCNNLINTIPAPIFHNLYGIMDKDFLAHDTIFLLVRPRNSKFTTKFDYLYVACKEYPFHRITKLQGGQDLYVLELRGTRENNIKDIIDFDILDTHTLKNCQIINNRGIRLIDNILMIGRFAQWDHSIKTEHVIGRLLDAKQMGR